LQVGPVNPGDGLFVATEDTWVVERYATRKVGNTPVLHAKAGNGTRLESHLRLQVSGVTGAVTGAVTSAKLKLRAVESTVDAYVYTVDDNAYQGGKLFKFNGCYDPTWRATVVDFLGGPIPHWATTNTPVRAVRVATATTSRDRRR